eukprot:TRINITY_DN4302_c0_g1_i8.p1 TRINITY_DN4302_c0_g1~~TRINITY_DN4302_c0_g1_i8.p1  ORF type:complete len:199 (+),score=33.60 TRINITY_DN4302_c0_g1_i8:409-1005(+)
MSLLRGPSVYRWLQQRHKGAVKYRPSDGAVKNFRSLFDQLDESRQGFIPVENLQRILQGSGINSSTVAKIIGEVDQDGSGAIDFNEFMGAMLKFNEDESNEASQSALLFPILVTTYTRRRHMQSVMNRGSSRQTPDAQWDSSMGPLQADDVRKPDRRLLSPNLRGASPFTASAGSNITKSNTEFSLNQGTPSEISTQE